MKHSRVLTIAAVAVLLVAAPLAQAQDNPAPQHGGKFLKCLSILNLSDAQKADIKEILDAEKPILQGLAATLRTDAAALKAALQATPPDGCAIGNALLKVHADKVAIRTELEKIKTNVEAVMTPEQKAKFEGCLQSPRNGGNDALPGEGESDESWE